MGKICKIPIQYSKAIMLYYIFFNDFLEFHFDLQTSLASSLSVLSEKYYIKH